MKDFISNMFPKGRQDSSSRGRSETDRTERAPAASLSHPRVQAISSGRMSAPREDRAADTGPWHIGKTVAEMFEIRGVLGRGGMGIVYLAHDTATKQNVAVKVPLGEFVNDEDERRRLTREGQAWIKLIHPHIVHAFDIRDDQTTDYRPAIFMDYCDGGSLAALSQAGAPLAAGDALDIGIQVCWAMAFAHNKGFIHRDLKPGNVLLASKGQALVTDLGLVKQLDLDDLDSTEKALEASDPTLAASIRQGLAGTPEYMAPEQWEGKPEKRSDIYAFGVMLYQFFCGCFPFTADSRAALRIPAATVPPPEPGRLNGDIPETLAELMIQCLAKKPDARPKDFDTIAEALESSYRDLTDTDYSEHRSRPGMEQISRADEAAQAWALVRLGNGCRLRGDTEDMETNWQHAVSLFQGLKHWQGLGACYLNLGHIHQRRNEYEPAMDLYRRGLACFKEIGSQTDIARCNLSIGNIKSRQGQYEKAMSIFQVGLSASRTMGDADLVAHSLKDMAAAEHSRGNHDKAIRLWEEALVICDRLGDKEATADCHCHIGMISGSCGRYAEAMASCRQSITICEEIGDKDGVAKAYSTMGHVCRRLGHYDEAMLMYSKALTIAEELGHRECVTGCCIGMANVARRTGQLEEAEKLYRRSIRLSEEIDDKTGIAVAYSGLGGVEACRQRYDEAMTMYKQSLPLFLEIHDPEGLGRCYANMASASVQLERYQEADEFFAKSLAIKEELGDAQGMAVCYANQATAAAQQGRNDGAMQLYRQALAIHQEQGDQDSVGKAWGNMGSTSVELGRFEDAWEFYRKSEEVFKGLGDPISLASCYYNMASLAEQTGDRESMLNFAELVVRVSDEHGLPVDPAVIGIVKTKKDG